MKHLALQTSSAYLIMKTTTTYSSSTAVAKALHGCINAFLKHLRELSAVLVDSRGLPVVQPGIVEHQTHVVTELNTNRQNTKKITQRMEQWNEHVFQMLYMTAPLHNIPLTKF